MRKGFTLAEILGVIVILGVIILLTTSVLTNTIKRSKQKALNLQISNIEKAARNYYIANNYPDISQISVTTLYEELYLNEKDIKNPVTDEKLDGCVIIEYANNQYNYHYKQDC